MTRNNTAIIAELQAIADRDPERILTPQAVVAAARPGTSPLHPYFIWNDGEAAERYRLQQAGQLVRRIKIHLVQVKVPPRAVEVEIVRLDQKPRSVRAFQIPRSARGAGGGYRTVPEIAGDDILADDMIATLRSELAGLIKRAQDYCDAAAAAGRQEPTLQMVISSIAEIVNEAWPSEVFGGRGDDDSASVVA